MSSRDLRINGKKHILHTFWDEFHGYFITHSTKCDFCGEIFKVNKGFALSEGGNVIICHKHLKEEFLKEIDVKQKSNVT